MEFKVKPVFLLDRRGEWSFRHSDGTRDLVADEVEARRRIAGASQELRKTLKFGGTVLQEAVVRDEEELERLKPEAMQADALLVYCIGYVSLETVFRWGLPVVAFGGQHIPVAALYACGVERRSNSKVAVALDYQEIDELLNVLRARKRLEAARIALLGFPPDVYSRWQHLPDFESARQRLGVQFCAAESRELVSLLQTVDAAQADDVVATWRAEAKGVVESQLSALRETARIYLAIKLLLQRERANAFGINCLEMMRALGVAPACYALTRLRDEGIPAACEADIVCLLTMMMLGYVSDAPVFMGNIVAGIPSGNILRVSHDVTPTKMAGFAAPARPYVLRNYHFGPGGVTAHVELDHGQEVTVARLSRELDSICVATGQLVECRETTACRTTLSIEVSDVRELVSRTFGNHQSVVYGNRVRLVRDLCQRMGIEVVVI